MRAEYRHGFRHCREYPESSLCVNRPVRCPGATEYDLALAKDLSTGPWGGLNWSKARRLPFLPLFFVATDGQPGMQMAQRAQLERERKAA